MNKTLNERAKSTRLHAGFLKMLQADSVSKSTYLVNNGPSVSSGFKIPEGKWQSKEVSLSHLKVFGCVSYVRVKDADRNKLDPKAKKCIFIGYGSEEMSYRFWDEQSRKVVRSRDITFNENVVYKDKQTTDSEATKKTASKQQVVFEDITEDNLVGNSGESESSGSLESGSSGNSDADEAVLDTPIT